MPYADIDVQREAQRIWAQKNAKKIPRDIIYRIDDLNLTKDLLSEKKSKHTTITSLKTWDDCIEVGKEIVSIRRVNRLHISIIALKSCTIRHGGDLCYNKEFTTVTAFARQIGLHPKTLWGWIAVKKTIVDNLKKETKEVNWSAASISIRKSKQMGKRPMELYDSLSTGKGRELTTAIQYVDGLEKFASFISKRGPDFLPNNEKQRALKALRRGLEAMRPEIRRIRKQREMRTKEQ